MKKSSVVILGLGLIAMSFCAFCMQDQLFKKNRILAQKESEIKAIQDRMDLMKKEYENKIQELKKQKEPKKQPKKSTKSSSGKSNSESRTPHPVDSSKLPIITMADLPSGIGFIDMLYPYADATEKKHGIPSQVFIAQACLETGYGKHIQGNNIFGIGHTVGKRKLTTVKKNGKYIKMYCSTYRYSSINECINAYVKLLTEKYPKVMKHSQDSKKFVTALGESRYCASKSYSGRLNHIIKKYNLD